MTTEQPLTREAELHGAEAARRLPGPDYYQVLSWVHAILRPRTYFEIGVARGLSLECASAPTQCIAIDPDPTWRPPPHWATSVHLFKMPSDEFFRNHARPGLRVDLAFVDGLHTFPQVLKDLAHLEPCLHSRSVVLVHDCLPLDERTSRRERETLFWTGDVWKAVPAVQELCPALKVAIIRTPPTGLAIISGFRFHRTTLAARCDEAERRFSSAPFRYWADYEPRLRFVNNSKEMVARYLAQALGGGSRRRTRQIDLDKDAEPLLRERPQHG